MVLATVYKSPNVRLCHLCTHSNCTNPIPLRDHFQNFDNANVETSIGVMAVRQSHKLKIYVESFRVTSGPQVGRLVSPARTGSHSVLRPLLMIHFRALPTRSSSQSCGKGGVSTQTGNLALYQRWSLLKAGLQISLQESSVPPLTSTPSHSIHLVSIG